VVCTFVNISHALFGFWIDKIWQFPMHFLAFGLTRYGGFTTFLLLVMQGVCLLVENGCDCFLLHHKSYWHWAIPVQLSRAIAPLQICIALGMLKTFGIIPS